jgi:hypothetical protein
MVPNLLSYFIAIIVRWCCYNILSCDILFCRKFHEISYLERQNIWSILDIGTVMMANNVLHTERELDLINAGRGLWLVKVPKFIANRWERTPGGVDAGELRITK